MWFIITILIIVVLYLIKTSCEKLIELNKEDNETEQRINELIQERDDYKRLRLEAIHNNTVLLNKSKELIQLVDEIEDKATRYIAGHEKEALGKIREFIYDFKSNINSH